MAATVAGRVLRTALPIYAGQAIACGATFVLAVVLLFVFRDDPTQLARYGVLVACLQWTSAVGVCGLATGLLRLYPVRPDDRRDLIVTAWLGVVVVSCALVAAIQFLPGVDALVIGDRVTAALVAPFLWKTAGVAIVAVAVAAMHATNSLRRKAALEASEAVAVAVLGIAGAIGFGLGGLLWGSFLGTMLLAVALRSKSGGGRFRTDLFRDMFRSGRADLLFGIVEAARPLVVLRIVTGRGWYSFDVAMLVIALALVAPFVALPEILARALYPATTGSAVADAALDRVHRRLFRSLARVTVPALALLVAGVVVLVPIDRAEVLPLVVLLPGVVVHALVNLSGAVVLTRERLPQATIASAGALAVAMGVALWLVPTAGALGGALALSVALVVRAVLLVLAVRATSRATPKPGPDAPKSLDEVRAAADPASFPRQVLAGSPTVLSLFSAAFHGRNDCIHLADGGVTEALLVDLDDEKLSEMRAIYPPSWRFAAGDAYVVAESLRVVGETFDLVVVDGWTGEAERMLTQSFPLWCALSRRHTVLMVSRPWFDKQGLEPTASAVEGWVLRRHGLSVTVEELHFRAGWVGGVWWIVVRTVAT